MEVSIDEFLNFPIYDSAAVDSPPSVQLSSYSHNSIDHFTDELLSIPTDDAAELEWLSRYMDDSFADFPETESTGADKFNDGGSRSKRSRISPGKEGSAAARRCMHCASEKTPQWRSGPQGPKTLCNACGVRYKSGRLVPEYRPAASPTFVLTQHSNSHRKVLELRRQKELLRQRRDGYGSHFGIC